MWSFIIGGVGIALPLVVPPVREAMGYGAPTPKAPPPVSKVRWLLGGCLGSVHAPCRLPGVAARRRACGTLFDGVLALAPAHSLSKLPTPAPQLIEAAKQ